MSGPMNSPVSDPVPFQAPDNTPKVNKVPVSDWKRLGNSRKYKAVDTYIEARKEYFRHWLPGGQALAELAITDPEAAGKWAAVASTIVNELDDLQFKIQRETIK
jgi:hypothetical protein